MVLSVLVVGFIFVKAADDRYEYVGTLKSFHESRNYCADKGGSLAYPRTSAESKKIQAAVPSNKRHGSEDYKRYIWLDIMEDDDNKITRPITWKNYHSGQPGPSAIAPSQKCISARSTTMEWYDGYCGQVLPFVCRFPATTTCE